MLELKFKISKFFNKRKLNKQKDTILQMKSETSPFKYIVGFTWKLFVLLFFSGLVLFPFFFMILGALMAPIDSYNGNKDFIPPSFSWNNFAESMAAGYWIALLNTTLVTTLSIVLQIIVSMMMGYALAYKRWWGKRLVWYFSLLMLMLPQIALIVGQYQIIVDFELSGGFLDIIAMVLPYAASVFSAYMFRNAFEAIPQRTKEAALIDGISNSQFLWKVGIKMVMPTIWTVGILTAFASWNAYMWPATLQAGRDDFRNPLGLWLFTSGKWHLPDGTELVVTSLRLAASIIAMAPLMILYFLFRKRIMDAVAKRGSAIKG